MIIGSGTLKGRSLKTLGKEPWLRPTSDKAREAVMDMLRPVLVGARFIDVCSGTGAVGIEALSNGAAHTTFVDADNRSVRLIRDNLKTLALQERASVVKGDATEYVSGLQGTEFDVLFADPPFDSGLQESILVTLSQHLRDAADGCIIIMEHASRQPLQGTVWRPGDRPGELQGKAVRRREHDILPCNKAWKRDRRLCE